MRKRRVKSYRGKDDLQDMIEELRLQYGLYLRDIAKYMKVSLTTVKKWASARTISQEHIDLLGHFVLPQSKQFSQYKGSEYISIMSLRFLCAV